MKTGYINLAAAALSLVCAIVWGVLFGDVVAVLWIVASVCWVAVGVFQIFGSDSTEPSPVSRIARRFFRIIGDWI